MSHLWEELTSAQLADRLAADPDCVALIPVGATEQHGPHLPVGTDTIIATALAEAAAATVAVVLPPLPFGASFFHGTREHWTDASEGPRIAVRNLLARRTVQHVEKPSYFRPHQYGTRIQFAGAPAPSDEIRSSDGTPADGQLFVATTAGVRPRPQCWR